MWENAYTYRSFAHFKRETFPIIAAIAESIGGPIRMADLACGPAVLEGIVLKKLGDRAREVHLLDIDPRFLDLAREHLADLKASVVTHLIDLNVPDRYPVLSDLNLLVSTNAIFHTTPDVLPDLYRWCHASLAEGGLFVNHQTFGHLSPGFGQVLEKHCGCLHDKSVLDDLDAELFRRSFLDAKASVEPVSGVAGGGYAGLSLPVSRHLEILRGAGFLADEIWRKGTSAVVLAVKSGPG